VKKIAIYVCVIIFSFQVLPVKELGNKLLKSFIKEIAVDMESDNDETPNTETITTAILTFNPSILFSTPRKKLDLFKSKITVAIQSVDRLPAFLIMEVPTPPPNF
jgi:hypothetical protein